MLRCEVDEDGGEEDVGQGQVEREKEERGQDLEPCKVARKEIIPRISIINCLKVISEISCHIETQCQNVFTRCSLNIVFFPYNFSELCQFCCSAGVLPAWCVYTH